MLGAVIARFAVLVTLAASMAGCSSPIATAEYEPARGCTAPMSAFTKITKDRLASYGFRAKVRADGTRVRVELHRGKASELDAIVTSMGRLDFVPTADPPPFIDALVAELAKAGTTVSTDGRGDFVTVRGGTAASARLEASLNETLSKVDASNRWFFAVFGEDRIGYLFDRAEGMERVPLERVTLMESGVMMRMDTETGDRFADLTFRKRGKLLAIVLDGDAKSAPMIRESIVGGVAVIETPKESERAAIAAVLSSGELPCGLVKVSAPSGHP